MGSKESTCHSSFCESSALRTAHLAAAYCWCCFVEVKGHNGDKRVLSWHQNSNLGFLVLKQ